MKCCMLLVSTPKLNKTGEIIPIKKHQFDTYAHISDSELNTMRKHLYLKSNQYSFLSHNSKSY